MDCLFNQKIREFSKYQKALIWSALHSAKYMNPNSKNAHEYHKLMEYFK